GSTIKKKNLTLTTADGGSLFIKNGKGKRITVNDLTLTYGNNAATMFANNNDTIDAKNYSMVSAVDGSKTKKSVNLTANDSGTLLKGGKAVDTLTSGIGNDTLTGNKGKDIFIYNSGDDIITDYTAGQDIIMIESDSTITASTLKGKDVILTVGNQTSDSIGSLTLKKGKGKSVKIVKSLDDISLPVIYGNGNATVSIATSDVSIISDVSDNVNSNSLISAIDVSKSSKSKIIRYSDTKSIRIAGGKKAYTISGNIRNDTIYCNAGNDSIVGYYGDDILNGGAGNDTIIGYSGNNTLNGGKGKDVFVYGGNTNDTITDYTAGQDKVYLDDGVQFKSAIYDGKNLLLTTSNNKTLTLKNAIKKKNIRTKITIVENGITTSQVYGASSITVANADCVTLNATTSINSGLTSIDASKRSKAIYIVGNNNNSTIKGSKSNDTVIAGFGANIIAPGTGNDIIQLDQNHQESTIIYTGGNDTVKNFDLSDNISLKSGITATANKVSNTEYVLTFNKGKTKIGTLDVSGNSAFSVDSDSNVNIGGISAKISTTSTITKAEYTEQFDAEVPQMNIFQDNLLKESNDLDSILVSFNNSVFSQFSSEFYCNFANTDTLPSFSISQSDFKK
ncbi:MAG: calcium-binding protein, partial [Selenomonadaceae bacterium]|nr:calcium-binding protein [Selenomonadaceae bacterium]